MIQREDFQGAFLPATHPAAPRRELPQAPGESIGGGDAARLDSNGIEVWLQGEIYNAHELRGPLGLDAAAPLPVLLVHAWRIWSVHLFHRLDGAFALALRDRDELVLYRDPYGPSRLYWHRSDDGRVVYATHLGALLQQSGGRRAVARQSLHEYLRFLDIAAPHTLFEGVHAVEAGHVVRCNAHGCQSQLAPVPSVPADAIGSFSEAVATLDAHLRRSVELRLVGASKPAAFLSGGIDSSLLCAMAASQRADTTAITVGFDTAPFDETPIAQRVASHLGLAHQVWRFSRKDYLSAFQRLSRHSEQPAADPATPATVLAFERCRSLFDTVLDGTGADDAVGVMPPRHVRVAVEYGSRVPRAWRGPLVRLMRALPGVAGYTPLLDFEHPADTMIRWGGFTRLEIERLCEEPVSFADTTFYRTFDRHRRDTHYDRYTALYNAMPSDRLTQATVVSGLHVRYPFYGRETDRFLRQLPTDYRHLPDQPKRILRELLARYVPRPIWDLPKHGFDFPLAAFLEDDDFALVRTYLDAGRWRGIGLLRGDLVWRYAQAFMAGDRRLTFRVWALVVLGAWLEQHELLN